MREVGRVKQAARAATWTGTSVGARACACGKQSSGGECEECRASRASAARTSLDSSGAAQDLTRIPVTTRTSAASQDGPYTTETQDAGAGGGAAPALPSGCYIENASFVSIPSGAVAATLTGNKLGADFNMIGSFNPRIPCLCACGEYRQYVRGTFTANGKAVTHSLGGGRNLSPTVFQEDGDLAAGTAYGYHSSRGTRSRFVNPGQSNGCRFEGDDQPGITGPSGTALGVNLEFNGVLIDTCRGNAQLAASSWTVSGTATVP